MEIVDSLNRRYIRISIGNGRTTGLEGYRVRMLQDNKIPGLLQTDKRHIDGQTFLYYDITDMQNLQSWQFVITKDIMNGFVLSLENLCESLEAFLLKQQEVCLLPEYIWYENGEGKWKFFYVPEYGTQQNYDMESLLEFIMDHIDCSDEEGLERFYDFYSDALQNLERLSIWELIRLWKKGETKHEVPDAGEKCVETPAVEDEENGSKRKRKERIYSVPYHGTKVLQPEEASLT